MQILETADLRDLLNNETFPCLSIYLNLGETIEQRQQAKTRLKSLMRSASEVLEESCPRESIPFLMRPLNSLINDMVRNPIPNAPAIALFRSFRSAGVYPISHPVTDYLSINDSFHLKPLLPEIQDHDLYYTVVLNHRQIRLYRGRKHRFGLIQTFTPPVVEEKATPVGEDIQPPRKRLTRYRMKSFASSGKVEDFVRKTEGEISKLITNLAAPIILVGSPLMRRFYRHANRHPGLLKEEVSATFGVNETDTIHRTTWPMIEREFAKRTQTITKAFKRMRGGTSASDNLNDVVKGVVQGRVSDLLISQNDKIFGRLERTAGEVIPLNPDDSRIGDDVLCDIAQIVLLSGGTAYVLPKDEMPTSSPLAALYRW